MLMHFTLGSFYTAIGGLGFAQSTSPANSSGDEQVAEALIPPKLLTQIELSYPQEALLDKLHGDVSVLVVVNEEGQVISAEIESGAEIFHDAALKSAQGLTFAPGSQSGAPKEMTTRVYFHFVPPQSTKNGKEEPVFELIVDDHSSEQDSVHAQTTLGTEELERASGAPLATIIEQVPGVQKAAGNSVAVKPIIRGHQERRLLVLQNGIRHENQKWGPDHGTEIDPFSAGEIAVVRGAMGTRYGPDAIGGVVLVKPPPMRSEVGVDGKVLSSFSSNGLSPYTAARLDFVPFEEHQLSFRVEGNALKSRTLDSPSYILGNTSSQIWNLALMCSYVKNNHQLVLSWRHHDFKAGVFYGIQNSSSDEFKAQLEASVPPTASFWTSTYAIGRPYQDVSHDLLSARLSLIERWGELEATYAFQLNDRQEFEQVRGSTTGPQYYFKLRTHSLDLVYNHPVLSRSVFDLEGGVGLQGTFQENVYLGFSLIPNFRSFSGGVFGFERISFARVDIEAGLRYDRLTRAAFLHSYDYERQLRQGQLMNCDYDGNNARCDADYDSTSLSIGTVFHVIPNHLDLRVELSSAGRFPNVDELYFNGSAPTFPVYALGDPELDVEMSRGGSTTIGVKRPLFRSELSFYSSLIDNFVYFAPDQGQEGKLSYEVNIRGAWPRYTFQSISAQFSGIDGQLELFPTGVMGANVRGSLVRARDTQTEEFLIGTPPDQLRLELVARLLSWNKIASSQLVVHTDVVAKQDKTDVQADFAPPPDGYVLFGLSAEADLGLKEQPIRMGLTVNNLNNVTYREYTSLLRYYADQPGRDVRIWAAKDF
ncbi:MAG: hypothetical protein CMK59_08005 [Proteobacteria bacterium]|nr:hypothetical protein [Pseudomonadota bacterium]